MKKGGNDSTRVKHGRGGGKDNGGVIKGEGGGLPLVAAKVVGKSKLL